MPSAAGIKKDFDDIISYREGARFSKMDLHTHSPASECSDFSLPDVMKEQFPKRPGSKTKAWRGRCFDFLKDIGKGRNPFREAYEVKTLKSYPRLAARPRLETRALKEIARAWLADIDCIIKNGTPGLTRDQMAERDRCVDRALDDIRRYLMSLFFPEEYVMRCYMEGLRLVALVDHNHPGYIVPRLHELGTWHSAVKAVNGKYLEEFRRKDSPGEQVRRVLVERLKLAERRLKSGDGTKPGKAGGRLNRIRSMLQYWKGKGSEPHPLVILPGVEITASNVHLLALFPPRWYVAGRIGNILRAIDIPEVEWGRAAQAAASASVQDTITLVDREGGIVIPAHSNSKFKGLLRLFTEGLALNKVLEHPALLALEIVEGNVVKGKSAGKTLKWLDKGRFRPGRSKQVCFVRGSDAHECRIENEGKGEDLGMRCTHIKMDMRHYDTPEEIFRSLRLALLSGQNRVIEHPAEDGYNYYASGRGDEVIPRVRRTGLLDCERHRSTILGMTVEGKGSYADGLRLRFNPYLNCVVGSGGKSTLVRLVGYAFGAYRFMPSTEKRWLPEQVRVFWREGDDIHCVERSGRNIDPDGRSVTVTWYKRLRDGSWRKEPGRGNGGNLVEIWPPQELGKHYDLEENMIVDLIDKLNPETSDLPLLINQPGDIFNSEVLFKKVLSKPHLKARQIIWSTGSPNVPTALDAEKIIVTGEKRNGKQMELVCGGDLHEDEIREQFLNHMEGGWPGFARRATLYGI